MAIEVDIHSRSDDDEAYAIGSVEIPIDTPDFNPDMWLEQRWYEWREVELEPESDSEFVTWLVANYECKELSTRHQVYLDS
jgi:hypothetical protein